MNVMAPQKNKEPRYAMPNSLISDIRKEQIMDAAVAVISETGYSNASLAHIAKRAKISTALISYYFQTKRDLTDVLVKKLLEKRITYIVSWVKEADTPMEKLIAYIRADLSYSTEHPNEGISVTELIYNARDENGVPYYGLESDDSDLLEEIIKLIQEDGGFPKLDPKSLSIIIKGAVGEYASNKINSEKIDQKTFGDELISVVGRLTGFSSQFLFEQLSGQKMK